MDSVVDRYRDRARAELLEQIARGNGTEWFNLTPVEELGGRTPTEAWRGGHRLAVVELVDRWYREGEASAAQHRDDPEFMAMIDRQRAAITAKESERAQARRPG